VLPSQLLTVKVLPRPVESAQHLAIRYTERLAEAGAACSVGSRGDSFDKHVLVAFAKAEAVVGGGASSRTSETAVLTSVP
jgi:hypothetical protein